MTGMKNWRGLTLRSCITRAGELRLAITEETVAAPAANEVVVRVEAAPINPTDMGLLFGPADLSMARLEGTAQLPVLVAPVPQAAMAFVALRIDRPLPTGVEGAGVVVAAGPGQEPLIGKMVAMIGDGPMRSIAGSRRMTFWCCPRARAQRMARPPWSIR